MSGAAHWLAQRVTAIALVPFALWLVAALAGLAGGDHAAATAWVARPPVAVALVLALAAAFWHLKLGLETVIEDYVHGAFGKPFWLLANAFACVAAAAASIFAVLKIALGG